MELMELYGTPVWSLFFAYSYIFLICKVFFTFYFFLERIKKKVGFDQKTPQKSSKKFHKALKWPQNTLFKAFFHVFLWNFMELYGTFMVFSGQLCFSKPGFFAQKWPSSIKFHKNFSQKSGHGQIFLGKKWPKVPQSSMDFT